MSIWFLLTNAAFDWMQEVHAKGYREVNMAASANQADMSLNEA
jgi:hypothetical protein